MKNPPGVQSHHARKIIRVGKSWAVVIPPHVLDHLTAIPGDYLTWDLNVPRFAVLSVTPVPPYLNKPEVFQTDANKSPPDRPTLP